MFSDDAALLFVRRDLHPAAVESRGYRLLTPDYDAMASLCGAATTDSTLARRIGAELTRARAESPWHARASLWLGLLELARGRGREAVVLLDEVERLAPLTPGLALRQGMAREAIGDRAGALTAYRRALVELADADAARRAMARLR